MGVGICSTHSLNRSDEIQLLMTSPHPEDVITRRHTTVRLPQVSGEIDRVELDACVRVERTGAGGDGTVQTGHGCERGGL